MRINLTTIQLNIYNSIYVLMIYALINYWGDEAKETTLQ